MNLDTLLLYIMTCLVINLSPGPSILYVTTVASSRGLAAAILSVAGMSTGILIHVLAASTGLAAILASSAIAFQVMKYLGAAYLVYLGVKTLMQVPGSDERTECIKPKRLESYFLRGVMVDLLNPKIVLFFLALFPSFVDSSANNVFISTLTLGIIFIVIGGLVNTGIAVLVARGANYVKTSGREFVERWIPGAVLVGLGVRLATDDL